LVALTGFTIAAKVASDMEAVSSYNAAKSYNVDAAAKGEDTIATGTLTAAQWALNVAMNAAMNANPIGLIILGVIALTAVVGGLILAFGDFRTPVERSIDSMKSLTAEAYNFKKTASDFDSVTSSFEDIDNKVIKTKEDMDALSETTDKAKELLNNLNTSDNRNSDLLQAIFGTNDKDIISTLIDNATPEQLEKYSKIAAEQSRKKALESNEKILGEAVSNRDVLKTSEGLALTKNAVTQIGYSSIKDIGAQAKMTDEQISNLSTT
jgi:predicted  nucleic acid-binding Zn-ribbon protein